jgi:hypothetical protein
MPAGGGELPGESGIARSFKEVLRGALTNDWLQIKVEVFCEYTDWNLHRNWQFLTPVA